MGVEINHPQDPTVEHDRIGIGIGLEEWGDLLDDFPDVALDQNPTVFPNLAGNEQVEVSIPERKRDPT